MKRLMLPVMLVLAAAGGLAVPAQAFAAYAVVFPPNPVIGTGLSVTVGGSDTEPALVGVTGTFMPDPGPPTIQVLTPGSR